MIQAQRPRSLPRALAAVGALIVVLVVAPVLLITEGGSPLPGGGFHRLRMLLSTHQGFDVQLATSWVIHGALLLAWATWAWMAVCIVIEVYSWATGRTPTHLPGSRTMQAMAACLVGTSMAMISIGSTLPAPHPKSPPLASVSQLRPFATPTLRVLDDYGFDLPQPVTPEAPPTVAPVRPSGALAHAEPALLDSKVGEETITRPPPRPTEHIGHERTHTVVGRETLWSIAEDQLGSARRWRELAALNYSVPQNDGQTLTKSHWIRPGWHLVLPADTSNLSKNGLESESGLPTAEYAAIQTAQPRMTSRDSSPNSNMNTGSSTGWISEVEREGKGPLPLVGAGLLGAGVVSLLDRMRRTQQRRREQGGLIRLPDSTRARMERRLRIGEGPETLGAVDKALKMFRIVCIDRGATVPLLRGIEVHRNEIEIVIDRPIDPEVVSYPFERRSERSSVVIQKVDISEVPDGTYNPFPTLVTVGTGSNGPQLINLEAVGLLELVGDREACEEVVRALALELATSYWADQFDLELVGFGNELTRFGRVASSSDPETVVQGLWHRRAGGDELLQSSSYRSFASARTYEDLDTWDPLVVICGPAVGEESAELLAAASDPRTGTAVVAPGRGLSTGHVWNVSSNGHSAPMEPFSSVVLPQGISADELSDIGELVDTAHDHESVGVTTHPYRDMTISMPSRSRSSEVRSCDDEEEVPTEVGQIRGDRLRSGVEAEVEVRVLGPVEVLGAEHEFTRAWAKELVVYLAMHPNGVSNDAWAAALWPDRLMASSSLHSTASVARRSWGHARDGEDHLPKAHGRLRLADSVCSDWANFVELADGRNPQQWRMALDLVRGRLFEGLRSADWPILEGIAPAMEATIVDVAGRLAGASLQDGEASGAEWAARKGLLISPYDERLYRMLLRSADRAGNPAGVESVMSELIRVVADDVEPFDSVHPSTLELYRSLSRRRTFATSRRLRS
jgi:DNA-binding SARP family transcriptional activator